LSQVKERNKGKKKTLKSENEEENTSMQIQIQKEERNKSVGIEEKRKREENKVVEEQNKSYVGKTKSSFVKKQTEIKQTKPKTNVEKQGDSYRGPVQSSNYNDQLMGEQKKQTRDSHKNNNSKYSSVSTKPSVIKDLNKEIDLDFLPKDVLYNEKTFDESNKNILAAIEILEKANEKQTRKLIKMCVEGEDFGINLVIFGILLNVGMLIIRFIMIIFI